MPDDAPPAQVWDLLLSGRHHRVETSGSGRRLVRWSIDGDVVAEKRTREDKVRLSVQDQPELGVLVVRFSGLGRPRRATLLEPVGTPDPSLTAVAGVGGVDLVPAPGSPAARHEATVRAHPRRYAVLAGLTGVARIVVPLLLAGVFAGLARFLPHLDLPSVPLPSLPRVHVPWPSIPWPSISWPSIPWPDWTLPGWVSDVAWFVHLVWPVVVGLGLAAAEIQRRRTQDRLRAERAAAQERSAETPDRSSTGTTGR